MTSGLAHDPGIGRLVEQQMRNWELARFRRAARQPDTRAPVADFICLSREIGAAGDDVAVGLGKRLGWPVFDKEILDQMAGDDTLLKQIYTSMDERDLSWCEEMLRPLMQPGFRKNDYFHRLCETVLSLSRQGSAVFVGRGADLMLPRDAGLRVRVIAPLECRIARLAQQRGLSPLEATREVQTQTEERTQFVRHHFHAEESNPHRYDLVINLEHVTVPHAINLIETARRIMRPDGFQP